MFGSPALCKKASSHLQCCISSGVAPRRSSSHESRPFCFLLLFLRAPAAPCAHQLAVTLSRPACPCDPYDGSLMEGTAGRSASLTDDERLDSTPYQGYSGTNPRIVGTEEQITHSHYFQFPRSPSSFVRSSETDSCRIEERLRHQSFL